MPSARANLPLLFVGQSAKETTVNTAVTILEALSVGGVKSRLLGVPPVSPIEGDTYIVPNANVSGVFVGQENRIAHYYNSAWAFYTPKEGWSTRVIDQNFAKYVFNGVSWVLKSDVSGWIFRNVNYLAQSNDKIVLDLTSPRTITLPVSPSNGDTVEISTVGTSTLTVDPNGGKINGVVGLKTLANPGYAITLLVFTGVTHGWINPTQKVLT